MAYFEGSLYPPGFHVRDTDLDKTLRKFRDATYPQYAVYLFSCAIFVAALFNIISALHVRLVLSSAATRASGQGDAELGVRPIRRSGNVAFRRLPYAVVNFARVALCRVSLRLAPGVKFTVIEVLVCTSHLLAILMFEFVNARSVAGILDPQYWANRTAVLAISQLALVVALSGKNNVISVLTGISHNKLNVFHRAASRTILILIWTHMWGRWKLGLTGDDSLHFGWVRSGIVANTCLTLIVILGTRQVRICAYETFLAVHNVLSIILLVSACIHVTNARQFLPYVWSACIFLGFDRFLRFMRILRVRYLSGHASGHAQAVLVALSADTVGVSLRISESSYAPVKFGWSPGQNAYLSVPVARWGLGLSIEAHPFTIASIDGPVTNENGSGDVQPGEKLHERAEAEMRFIIRVRNGFTRRLHERAVRTGGSCTVPAYVDGPYGNPPAVFGYPSVILVAGGSGVSFTLPLLLDLVRRATKAHIETVCSRVTFIWYIRERVHFEAIAKDVGSIQSNRPANLQIEVLVFVTGGSEHRENSSVASVDSDTEKRGEDHVQVMPSGLGGTRSNGVSMPETPGSECEKENTGGETRGKILSMKYGKPAVMQLLNDGVGSSEKSVAVCVSGPQSLIDDVRSALRNPTISSPLAVLRGGPSVFLHVENFGM